MLHTSLVAVVLLALSAANALAAENTGPVGPPAPPQVSCDECWAVVNANATLARGNRVAAVTVGDVSPGSYVVTFTRSVAGCSYVATPGVPGAGITGPADITVATRAGNNNAVYLAVFGPAGSGRVNTPFHLQIECF